MSDFYDDYYGDEWREDKPCELISVDFSEFPKPANEEAPSRDLYDVSNVKNLSWERDRERWHPEKMKWSPAKFETYCIRLDVKYTCKTISVQMGKGGAVILKGSGQGGVFTKQEEQALLSLGLSEEGRPLALILADRRSYFCCVADLHFHKALRCQK